MRWTDDWVDDECDRRRKRLLESWDSDFKPDVESSKLAVESFQAGKAERRRLITSASFRGTQSLINSVYLSIELFCCFARVPQQ